MDWRETRKEVFHFTLVTNGPFSTLLTYSIPCRVTDRVFFTDQLYLYKIILQSPNPLLCSVDMCFEGLQLTVMEVCNVVTKKRDKRRKGPFDGKL